MATVKNINQKMYDSFRENMVSLRDKNGELYDRNVLKLSSAGLGLSVALVKGFTGVGAALQCKPLLVVSWSLFVATIISTMVSFLLAQHAIDKRLEYAEKYYLEDKDEYGTKMSPLHCIVIVMNYCSGIMFIAGVVTTVIFCAENL